MSHQIRSVCGTMVLIHLAVSLSSPSPPQFHFLSHTRYTDEHTNDHTHKNNPTDIGSSGKKNKFKPHNPFSVLSYSQVLSELYTASLSL